MPFRATRRHEYWTVDVRYIEDHLLGPDPIYSISIMDNFSRAIISSTLSPKQDLTAYLIVLYSAIRLHGHWKLYGELGLAKRKATIWLSKEHLTVEYGDEPLSQYVVQYQPDEKHLRTIGEPRHFETRYRTPQLDLWQQGEVEWHLVKRLPDYAPRQKKKAVGEITQQPLFITEEK